jgi:hypothetical protein
MGAAVQGLAVRRAFRQGLNEADFFDDQNALAFKLWQCPLLARSRHDLLRESAFAVAIWGKADIAFCSASVRL